MKNSTKLLLLRIFHIFLIILFLISIVIIYYSVFTGYKGNLLAYGVILLLIEGLGLIIWRECPLAPLHRKLGDTKYIWKLFYLPILKFAPLHPSNSGRSRKLPAP